MWEVLEFGVWLAVSVGGSLALTGLAIRLGRKGPEDAAEELDDEDQKYLNWWLKERS